MLVSAAVFGPEIFPDHLRDRPAPHRAPGTRIRRPVPASRRGLR
jgi:hypothetical protein